MSLENSARATLCEKRSCAIDTLFYVTGKPGTYSLHHRKIDEVDDELCATAAPGVSFLVQNRVCVCVCVRERESRLLIFFAVCRKGARVLRAQALKEALFVCVYGRGSDLALCSN